MGAPAFTWRLYLIYEYFLLNDTHCSLINGILITKAAVFTADIIPLLHFHFWEPVCYRMDESDFLSHSTEICVRWVGIAKHVGHAIPFNNWARPRRPLLSHLLVCSKNHLLIVGIVPVCDKDL